MSSVSWPSRHQILTNLCSQYLIWMRRSLAFEWCPDICDWTTFRQSRAPNAIGWRTKSRWFWWWMFWNQDLKIFSIKKIFQFNSLLNQTCSPKPGKQYGKKNFWKIPTIAWARTSSPTWGRRWGWWAGWGSWRRSGGSYWPEFFQQ